MMYDYESDLIEFWGKVIFFGAFILIWALVFYFVMYSFPFLFISPLTFSITLSFLSAYVFFTRFFLLMDRQPRPLLQEFFPEGNINQGSGFSPSLAVWPGWCLSV